MARSFWLEWWLVLLYMALLGALSLVVGITAMLTPRLSLPAMYLVIGVLMYASDLRYWVMLIYNRRYVRQQHIILVLWPLLYPYYLYWLIRAGWRRFRDE